MRTIGTRRACQTLVGNGRVARSPKTPPSGPSYPVSAESLNFPLSTLFPQSQRPRETAIPSCRRHLSLASSPALHTAAFRFCYSENDMTSHLKHAYFGLRALILSLVLFLGGAVVHAQEAAAAPSSTDSKPATDAEFIAAADEVLGQLR